MIADMIVVILYMLYTANEDIQQRTEDRELMETRKWYSHNNTFLFNFICLFMARRASLN